MKLLVTGGAGFIGSHLVSRLVAEDHQVVVLDNLLRGNKIPAQVLQQVQFVQGDVRDDSLVLRVSEGCDQVYHFAAVLGVDVVADHPVETMETEVLGLRNVAQAALQHGNMEVIYASTSGVYGKAAIEHAVSEDFNVSPQSSYAIAKRFNEIYLAALHAEHKLRSIALRFFNVYGVGQDTRMVIPRFFAQALAGEPITIFGSGKQTRDFTYVDDVVEATVRLAGCIEGNEIVNISNESEYSIQDVARLIVQICNSKSELNFLHPPQNRYDFEVERRYGSSQKLAQLTGFKPSTLLETGLRRIYEHLKKGATN